MKNLHRISDVLLAIVAILALSTSVLAEDLVDPGSQTPDPSDNPPLVVFLAPNACSTCTCYFSSDCGSGQYCDYDSCTHTTVNGKLRDGTCKKSGGGGGSIGNIGAFAEAVDLLFRAYLEPARDGGGDPDPKLVGRSQSIALPAEGHRAAHNLVQNTVDLALGFDFVPQAAAMCGGASVPFLGQGHGSPQLLSLLEHMQEGVVNALKSKDATSVASAIRSFYAKHRDEDIHPGHSGRCYPHGHKRYPYKGPEDCHIQELTGFVEHYLR